MSVTNDEKYFAAIVRQGTLSAAAKELGLTQPALTKALKRLREKYVDGLFELRSGVAELTPAGGILHDHIQQSVLEEERLRNKMDVAKDASYGFVNVGFGGYIAEAVAVSSYLNWVEKYQNFRVKILVSSWDHLQLLLESEHLDFYCANFEKSRVPGDFYGVIELPSQPTQYLLRKGHPLLTLERATWEDIRQYPFCRIPVPPNFKREARERLADASAEKVHERPEKFVECADASIIKDILRKTDSLTGFAPNALDLDGRDSDLTVLESEVTLPRTPLAIIYHKHRKLSESAKRYIDILIDQCQV